MKVVGLVQVQDSNPVALIPVRDIQVKLMEQLEIVYIKAHLVNQFSAVDNNCFYSKFLHIKLLTHTKL